MNDRSHQRWSEREIDFLKKKYRKMTYKEIGRRLGRTERAVRNKCHVLGLRKISKIDVGKSHQRWSEENINFLRKNYRKMTHKEMSKKLGRTATGVEHKCRTLGLKNWSVQKWTEREIDFLKKNYQKMTYEEMGKELSRTRESVRGKCRALDLKKLPPIVVNKEPTPDLAYVLGVCHGDGWVSKSKNGPQYMVGLGVMDKEFAISFRNALKNIGLRPYRIFQRNEEIWRVLARGKEFYEWYYSLDYEDILSSLITKKMKKEFIRGFYESEGSFYRKGSDWRVSMSSCDFELLKLVEEVVNSLGFKTTTNRQTSQLRGETIIYYRLYLLGGSREVIRFLREISPCILRKSLKKVDFSDKRGLTRPCKLWSETEENFLLRNYPKKKTTIKQISKILKRSKASVKSKARRMGLKRPTCEAPLRS